MSSTAGNPLSAIALTTLMTASLPKNPESCLRNSYDAVALLTHACMIAVGFRLVGLGEEHRVEAQSEAEDTQSLPNEWNSTQTSDYAFRYAHSQSSLEYLIKTSRLGSKAVVNGLGIGDDKVHSLDIQINDYISESALPFSIAKKPQANEAMQHIFISMGRITDLAALMKLKIIQKLAPGLQKEGYEDSVHEASQPSSSQNRDGRRDPIPGRDDGNEPPTHDPLRDDRLPPFAQPRPFDDPLATGPRRPFPAGEFAPPGFDDEYDMNRPLARPGGDRRPLNIGERDLYPPGLGPNDPLRGGLGGIGGGGMHPTFDDPLFGGMGGPDAGVYDGRRPPGARYDPIGPGDGPPNLRGGPRFGGGGPPSGFGGGGRPPNPFGGFGGNDFI